MDIQESRGSTTSDNSPEGMTDTLKIPHLNIGQMFGRFRGGWKPLPPSSSTTACMSIQFKAMTREDIHVGFSNESKRINVQVVAGTCGNTEALIRTRAVKAPSSGNAIMAPDSLTTEAEEKEEKEKHLPGDNDDDDTHNSYHEKRIFCGRLCSEDTLTEYWILIHSTKGISFGLGPVLGEQVVLSKKSRANNIHPSDLACIAFSSWKAPIRYRDIHIKVYDKECAASHQMLMNPMMMMMQYKVFTDRPGGKDIVTPEQRQRFLHDLDKAKERRRRFGGGTSIHTATSTGTTSTVTTVEPPRQEQALVLVDDDDAHDSDDDDDDYDEWHAPELKSYLDSVMIRSMQRRGGAPRGFVTGFDLTSEAERRKREERMTRFQTPKFAIDFNAETAQAQAQDMTDAEWNRAQVEIEKRKSRLEKFGPVDRGGSSSSSPLTTTQQEQEQQWQLMKHWKMSTKVQHERLDAKEDHDDDDVVRDDAIHLFCLDDHFQRVRTKDIFSYFVNYGASYVEWNNDSSCTVVFEDTFTASRAFTVLTREILLTIGHDHDQVQEEPQRPSAGSTTTMEETTTTTTTNTKTEDHDDDDDSTMMDVATSGSSSSLKPMDVEEKEEKLNWAWTKGWQVGQPLLANNSSWRILLRKGRMSDFPLEKRKTNNHHSYTSTTKKNSNDQDKRRRRHGSTNSSHGQQQQQQQPKHRRHRNKNSSSSSHRQVHRHQPY